jgi:transcriptional regulator with XRE-family HTH domain
MKTNKKISQYFNEKDISQAEIAESYGGSPQNISNILNRESGKVPFEFLVWIAENYPDLDINALLQEENDNYIIRESKSEYAKLPVSKDEILNEMSKILDKYFQK